MTESSALNHPKFKNWKALLALLGLVFCVNFLTMPRMEYPGDPSAVRMGTGMFIERGSFAVPAEIASKQGSRGQFFVENEKTGLWYSKYGIFASVLNLPPLLLERVLGDHSLRVLCLNLYNLLLTLFIVIYLFRIVSLYTQSRLTQNIFILSVLYCTFMWNYLRAQNSEIFQVLFILGSYFHLIQFKRTTSSRSLAFCVGFLVLLSLTKTLYFLLAPLLCVLVPLAAVRLERPFLQLPKAVLLEIRNKWGFYLFHLFIPLVVLFGFILFLNHYQFGSPWSSGYTQWERERDPFSGNILEAFFGFFFEPQRSLFLHFPLVIFAILGFRRFFSKHTFDFTAIAVISLSFFIVICKFMNWTGQWCYGPRYLLFMLPLLSLPAIEVFDTLWAQRDRLKSWAMAAGIGLVLLWSGYLQTQINSLEFFVFYQVEGVFSPLKLDPIQDYFAKKHLGAINSDLQNYKARREDFYPLDVCRRVLAPDSVAILQSHVDQALKSNYYWFPD